MDRFLSPAHSSRAPRMFCTQAQLRRLPARAALPPGRGVGSPSIVSLTIRKGVPFRPLKVSRESVRNCHVWKKSLTVAHIGPYTPAHVWWLRWLGVFDGGLYTHRS